MLTITLDENIPYTAEAFNTLGQTRLLAGRSMRKTYPVRREFSGLS